MSGEDVAPCPGDGGSVFTYEGPQFGAHIIEESCRVCSKWHEPTRATNEESS